MSDNNMSCGNHEINSFVTGHLSPFSSKEFKISSNFFDSALQIFLKIVKYYCKDFTIRKTEAYNSSYFPNLVDNIPNILE